MIYPANPFDKDFNHTLITNLLDDTSTSTISNEEYKITTSWLCTFPKITSYRVNTIYTTAGDALKLIQKHCDKVLGEQNVKVEIHSSIDNVVIIHSKHVEFVRKHEKEVIVDVDCACAVLRGAHIYAPGVLGLLSGSQVGDQVSIYADISRKCKRGLLKIYEDDKKVFIGNGIVRMQRFQLFADNVKSSGIAVELTETISGCPSIGDNFLPKGFALLQNIPSILCVINLDPQPSETILDMCASPGNKTTHIADIMQNKGLLIAIDKTPKKLQQLKFRCAEFGAIVTAFEADSTKLVSDSNSGFTCTPFKSDSFDRILLDAPCSVLGKRPQLINRLSDKEIKSYVPLQRKLLSNAVKLLKKGGTLVYSTCTITLAENEGMVAWALRNFPCLALKSPKLSLGSSGWPGTALTSEQRQLVQRFGPDDNVDSVGFFFACFTKK